MPTNWSAPRSTRTKSPPLLTARTRIMVPVPDLECSGPVHTAARRWVTLPHPRLQVRNRVGPVSGPDLEFRALVSRNAAPAPGSNELATSGSGDLSPPSTHNATHTSTPSTSPPVPPGGAPSSI